MVLAGPGVLAAVVLQATRAQVAEDLDQELLEERGVLSPAPAAVQGEGLAGLELPLLTLLIQVTAVAGLVRWDRLRAQPLVVGMAVGQVVEPAGNFSPAQRSSLSLLPPAHLSAKPGPFSMPFTAGWKVVEVVAELVR